MNTRFRNQLRINFRPSHQRQQASLARFTSRQRLHQGAALHLLSTRNLRAQDKSSSRTFRVRKRKDESTRSIEKIYYQVQHDKRREKPRPKKLKLNMLFENLQRINQRSDPHLSRRNSRPHILSRDTCQISLITNGQKQSFQISVKEKTSKQICEDLKNELFTISNRLQRKVLGFTCKPLNLKIDYLLTRPAFPLDILSGKSLTIQPFFADSFKRKRASILSFKILRCIGAGGFAKVFLVRSRLDGQFYAMKLIHKEMLTENKREVIVINERDIMTNSSHPFLMELEYSFESRDYIIFVMEYCPGGELFSYIKKFKRFDQDMARFYFLEILLGIEELHSKNILYRDIKPENILIDIDGHVRITDFGLSKPNIHNKQLAHSFCGSPQYMSPEMIMRTGHSFTVDYYCLGALLYEMVVGIPPFYSRNTDEIYEAVLAEEVSYPKNLLLSNEIKSLMTSLLTKNPKLRLGSLLGVKQILAHPWFGKIKRDNIIKKKLIPPIKTDPENLNFDFTAHKESELEVRQMLQSQMYPESQKFRRLFSEDFYYEKQKQQADDK